MVSFSSGVVVHGGNRTRHRRLPTPAGLLLLQFAYGAGKFRVFQYELPILFLRTVFSTSWSSCVPLRLKLQSSVVRCLHGISLEQELTSLQPGLFAAWRGKGNAQRKPKLQHPNLHLGHRNEGDFVLSFSNLKHELVHLQRFDDVVFHFVDGTKEI